MNPLTTAGDISPAHPSTHGLSHRRSARTALPTRSVSKKTAPDYSNDHTSSSLTALPSRQTFHLASVKTPDMIESLDPLNTLPQLSIRHASGPLFTCSPSTQQELPLMPARKLQRTTGTRQTLDRPAGRIPLILTGWNAGRPT